MRRASPLVAHLPALRCQRWTYLAKLGTRPVSSSRQYQQSDGQDDGKGVAPLKVKPVSERSTEQRPQRPHRPLAGSFWEFEEIVAATERRAQKENDTLRDPFVDVWTGGDAHDAGKAQIEPPQLPSVTLPSIKPPPTRVVSVAKKPKGVVVDVDAPTYIVSSHVFDLISEDCPGVREYDEGDEADLHAKWSQPTAEALASRERLQQDFAEIDDCRNAFQGLEYEAGRKGDQSWRIAETDVLAVALHGGPFPPSNAEAAKKTERNTLLATKLVRHGIPSMVWGDDKKLMQSMVARMTVAETPWSMLVPRLEYVATSLASGKQADVDRVTGTVRRLANIVTEVTSIDGHETGWSSQASMPSRVRQHILMVMAGKFPVTEPPKCSVRDGMATFSPMKKTMLYLPLLNILGGIGALRTIWHEWRRCREIMMSDEQRKLVFTKSLLQGYRTVLQMDVLSSEEHFQEDSYGQAVESDLRDMGEAPALPRLVARGEVLPVPRGLPDVVGDALGIKSMKDALVELQSLIYTAVEAHKNKETLDSSVLQSRAGHLSDERLKSQHGPYARPVALLSASETKAAPSSPDRVTSE